MQGEVSHVIFCNTHTDKGFKVYNGSITSTRDERSTMTNNTQYLMDNDEFDMLQEKYAGFDAIVIMVNEES